MEKINTKKIKVLSYNVINDNQIHVEIEFLGTKLFEINNTELDNILYENIENFIKNLIK